MIVVCIGVDVCAVCILGTFSYNFIVRVTEWPPIWKYLPTRLTICFLSISNLLSIHFFPTSVFWSGNYPFPGHCPFTFVWSRVRRQYLYKRGVLLYFKQLSEELSWVICPKRVRHCSIMTV